MKLEEGAQDGRLSQFYLSLANKDDKFLVVFAFIKLGLLEVGTWVGGMDARARRGAVLWLGKAHSPVAEIKLASFVSFPRETG